MSSKVNSLCLSLWGGQVAMDSDPLKKDKVTKILNILFYPNYCN